MEGQNRLYRLQCYRSTGPVSADSNTHLRLYVLEAPSYAENAGKYTLISTFRYVLMCLLSVYDSSFIVDSTDALALVADQVSFPSPILFFLSKSILFPIEFFLDEYAAHARHCQRDARHCGRSGAARTGH